MSDDKKVFKFPHYDQTFEFDELKLEEDKAKIAEILAKDIRMYDIQSKKGIIADQTAFNNMYDTIGRINRYKRNIRNKMKLTQLNNKHIDYTTYTIHEMIDLVYTEFFNLYDDFIILETFNFININNILSKGVRKLLILIFLFFCFLIAFFIINILD